MSHQLPAALLVASIAILTTPACDEASPDVDGLALASPEGAAPDADDVSFREPGPPAALYITTYQGADIYRAGFKSIVDNCWKHGNPRLTCTLSWYKPDKEKDEQVVGIGCSMVASTAFLSCHRDIFLQNGGKAL